MSTVVLSFEALSQYSSKEWMTSMDLIIFHAFHVIARYSYTCLHPARIAPWYTRYDYMVWCMINASLVLRKFTHMVQHLVAIPLIY